MTNRGIGATALLLALAGGLTGCQGRHSRHSANRPSVVLVVIDTLRQDHLATYGYPRDTAPFLGELARQGAVFQGLTPAPWTKPATASLLTGLHPLRHQAVDRVDRLPEDAVTLAEQLRNEGYSTLGASANGWVSPEFGFNRGFDTFLYRDNLKAAAFNRELLPRLDRLRPPFFLYVHYIDPHIPYSPDVGWDGRPLPANLRNRPVTLEEIDATHFQHRPPELLARARDLYDGEIRSADNALRGLVDRLAQRGLMKNTLLVVAADHGEELEEHGRMSHGQTVYQEVLQVPLVIHAPGIVRPGRFGRASLMDVVPTLLDLLGIEHPQGSLDGESLLGQLASSRSAVEERPFLSHLDFVDGTGLALIQGRWKLVLGKNPYRKQLFDLASDPGEHRDLLESPEVAGIFQRLGKELALRYNNYSRAALERSTIQIQGQMARSLAALGYIAGDRAAWVRHVPRRIGPPDPFPDGLLGWAAAGGVGSCVQLGEKEGLPLLAGWYEPEGDGRWSAPSSSLVLSAPPDPIRLALRIHGANFRPGPVRVTIRVNRRPALRTELPVGPFQSSVPLAGVPRNTLSLVEIATDSEFVPARYGQADQRSLGLFLTEVCLDSGSRGPENGP